MKKIIVLTSIIFLCCSYLSFSQNCLPNGITFSSQNEIDNFSTNYPGCTEIEGEVLIQGVNINNLNGLSVLTKLHSNLAIVGNTSLIGLNGLHNIDTIAGGLWIEYNPVLTDLSGLDNLQWTGDFVGIWDNQGLLSLNGLQNLNYVGGNLEIWHNYILNTLSGLDNLKTVEANFWIEGCHKLLNLNGLVSLTYIGGRLEIDDNEILNNLWGLHNLTTVGWFVSLRYNYQLVDLVPLYNLTFIGGKLEIKYNNVLVSLHGLHAIDPGTITDLFIVGNPALSECEVASVCEYLASPAATVEISENDDGCKNEQEVLDACIVGHPEKNIKHELGIYPNPAKDRLNISFPGIINVKEINIYNQIGQVCKHISRSSSSIDISSLESGTYFLEIIADHWNKREKFIVK